MYITARNSIVNSISTAFYIHFSQSTPSFLFILFFCVLSEYNSKRARADKK